jgi:hypothetical protein
MSTMGMEAPLSDCNNASHQSRFGRALLLNHGASGSLSEQGKLPSPTTHRQGLASRVETGGGLAPSLVR